ncbi:MAG TPA: serine/threonine-protein kinase, partial [Candidatus Acidoferrales bacterium]|nr:serine/threonine-protein kinase [Candidatus Acidoferrales bacterium]
MRGRSSPRMLGKSLNHYRVLERVGAGGMGVVYRARDENLRRDVALKILPAETAGDPVARTRLLSEARLASSLNHPNICTIYEVGEAEGQAFIAMEFVEGETLSARIPAEGLPVETLLHLGEQLAGGLEHAHAHGVIHRDLKSSNIRVTTEGRSKILDFGLAERVPQAETATAEQAEATPGHAPGAAGTLSYMAPETLRGEAPDARSDLWALGVILHEMAAGSLPFRGATGYAVSSAILRDAPAGLPEAVPQGLREVIRRCLA